MFKKIEDFFDGLYNAPQLVPPGMYTCQSAPQAALPHKMHLRVEKDGSGVLVLNASTVLHLNPSAAEYAYHLVRGEERGAIAQKVANRYQIPLETAQTDLQEFMNKLDLLLTREDLDPVTYLDVQRVAPYSQKLSAPYRLDCALTYQVSPGTQPTVAPNERVNRELNSAEWQVILEKAWSAGIPHVIFTGGEPSLRQDLPDLISKAEELGLVCGLLSDGLRLAEKKYAKDLLQRGLDHILLLANEADKRFWAALKVLMPQDIAVSVHHTITPKNAPGMAKLLEKLAKAEVRSLSLSAVDDSLAPDLESARAQAAALGMSLVWDLPVPYSACHSLALELAQGGDKAPQGAGQAWLYVEPDGDVLPAQGVNRVLGNLLRDPWHKIWKSH